jgi:hypothetical protein
MQELLSCNFIVSLRGSSAFIIMVVCSASEVCDSDMRHALTWSLYTKPRCRMNHENKGIGADLLCPCSRHNALYVSPAKSLLSLDRRVMKEQLCMFETGATSQG